MEVEAKEYEIDMEQQAKLFMQRIKALAEDKKVEFDSLILKGEFVNFSRLLERLGAASYLVRVSNLNIRKNTKPETGITVNLSIMVLTK